MSLLLAYVVTHCYVWRHPKTCKTDELYFDSPCWDVDNSSHGIEIPCVLWKAMITAVATRARHLPVAWSRWIHSMSSNPVSFRFALILSALLSLVFKISFFFLEATARFRAYDLLKWAVRFRFFIQCSLNFSFLPCVPYAPARRVQIMGLLIKQFFPLSC
jgi:hypothetical protein